MSISLRNFEENDFEAIQALMMAQGGEILAASGYLKTETLRPSVLIDTIFGLVAEKEDKIAGTVSMLMEQETAETVLGLLGRLCVRDTSERPAVAASLVATLIQSLEENLQLSFAEIPSTDLWAQAACEQAGFIPCGFLPQKFHGEVRLGCVVYAYLSQNARNKRRPRPGIIPGAQNLAIEALKAYGFIGDIEVRQDVAAYPTEGNFTFVPIDLDAVQMMLQGENQRQTEVFRILQDTQTHFHLPLEAVTYMSAREGERVVGAIGYVFDSFDKRIQITNIIALDVESEGFMIAQLFETLNKKLSPDYWEIMVSAHATRMQKTLDQVGFIPCAYIPAFIMEQGMRSDAIKMVKLNVGYESDPSELTSAGKNIFTIMDTIFREYGVGMAVLKLLRDLRIFCGMGEGELRQVVRLFSQKLFRPKEVIFEEGSTGQELYVVERGEIDIYTKNEEKILGTIRSGAVLGEIAFLNGEPRTAKAVSKSATIARVIHRSDFDRLVQRESHLGLIFFQNIALDLAAKLKQSVIQARNR